MKTIIYTFVIGNTNWPKEDVRVGDQHTWDQSYGLVGGYPGKPSGRPPKRITGTVVAIRDGMWVDVEAEDVRLDD